jgi:O-antigen ligase
MKRASGDIGIRLAIIVYILELAILGIFSPLALFPGNFPDSVLFAGLILLVVPFGVRKVIFGHFTVPTSANLPMGFLLIIVLPTAVAVTPVWVMTWPALLRLLWSIAIFYTVLNWRWSAQTVSTGPERMLEGNLPTHLQILTTGFLGVGVIFTAVGLLTLQPTNQIPELGAVTRLFARFVQGNLGLAFRESFNTNRLAGALLLYAPLAWGLLFAPLHGLPGYGCRGIAQTVKGKLILLLLSLLFTVALLLTQSRGGWLAFSLAFGLLLLLVGRKGQVALAILIATCTALVAYVGPLQLVQRITTTVGLQSPAPGFVEYLLLDRNLSGRYVIWRRAWHGIMDAPLTGVGLNAFGQVAQEPYPLQGFTPDQDIGYAHNMFLQLGLDFGIPGLSAYALLLVMVVAALIKLYTRVPASSVARFWSAGLLASVTAHMLWGITDAIPLGTRTAVGIWYLWGLAIAAGIQHKVERYEPSRECAISTAPVPL